jgi:hypothetical protein
MNALKGYWLALVDALSLRRVLALSIIFAVVSGTVQLAPLLAREFNRTMFLGAPPVVWGAISLLLVLCGFLLKRLKEYRELLEPRMTLTCEPDRGGLVQTPVTKFVLDKGQPVFSERDRQPVSTRVMATSIRVSVRAASRVAPRNATAFLTKFERLNEGGVWETSRYNELVQVPWAGEGLAVDLSDLFPKFASVLHIEEDNKIGFWNVGMPHTLAEFLARVTKYRLTVAVIAEGMTEQRVIEVDWKGKWDTVTVRAV